MREPTQEEVAQLVDTIEGWVGNWSSDTVLLDGDFTIADLEKILALMRKLQSEDTSTRIAGARSSTSVESE